MVCADQSMCLTPCRFIFGAIFSGHGTETNTKQHRELGSRITAALHYQGTMDFDETRLYFSHQQLQKQAEDQNIEDEQQYDDEDAVDLDAVRRHFREFLRTYHAKQSQHNHTTL